MVIWNTCTRNDNDVKSRCALYWCETEVYIMIVMWNIGVCCVNDVKLRFSSWNWCETQVCITTMMWNTGFNKIMMWNTGVRYVNYVKHRCVLWWWCETHKSTYRKIKWFSLLQKVVYIRNNYHSLQVRVTLTALHIPYITANFQNFFVLIIYVIAYTAVFAKRYDLSMP